MIFTRPDQVAAPLYVVTSVFNPVRYRSRWRLYKDFEAYVEQSGAILYTAEVAYGAREFAVTEAHNPRHLQLRTTSELWLKENALNLAIARLPADWKYVAWVDADVTFARPDWANETLQQLQHYDVVQMWSEAVDLSPQHEILHRHKGFVAAYQRGQLDLRDKPYEGFHPGYAWAYRRSALDQLGGLLDTAILGAADRHMATALLSNVSRSYPPGLSRGYVQELRQWQRRAAALRKNIGHVPGALFHAFHGAKVNRQYLSRWQILKDHAYNPDTDLKRDWQGVYQLETETPRQIRLRDDIRAYFRRRDEDGGL